MQLPNISLSPEGALVVKSIIPRRRIDLWEGEKRWRSTPRPHTLTLVEPFPRSYMHLETNVVIVSSWGKSKGKVTLY